MKKIYLLLLMIPFIAKAGPGDTTWITAHNATDMTWYGGYTEPVLFPDGNTSYHKILMVYTMGCASGGCSDWDYTTRIELLKKTGELDSNVASIDTISLNPLQIDTTWSVFDAKQPYELGRVITPYANGFSNTWKHDFVFDVTDYYPLLKDSADIRAFYSGWSSGFSATVRFAFIEGYPARKVSKVESIYRGSRNYTVSSEFESAILPPKTITIDSTTEDVMLRVYISGHGFNNSLNAAEFYETNYLVKVDNQTVATQSMWRDDCGSNPIWPQPGTWLFDRANWCPGDKAWSYDHLLTPHINGNTLNLDVDIQPYSYSIPQGGGTASYIVEAQLFYIESKNQEYDVEVEDILSPSDEDEDGRMNPVCGQAVIKIRNKGALPMTSCTIEYGVSGGTPQTFNWTGNLNFMESEIVELPMMNESDWQSHNGETKFYAKADLPNGQPDFVQENNWYNVSFTPPPAYPPGIRFTIRANNAPNETTWVLKNIDGTTIDTNGPMQAGQTYVNNINLQPGCYYFLIEDSDEDGLTFFANNDGTGNLSIRNDGGQFFFTNLNPNFGTAIKHYFTVGYGIGLKENILNSNVTVYPNPAQNQVFIDLNTNGRAMAKIKLLDLSGKIVSEREFSFVDNHHAEMDVRHLPKGVYQAMVLVGEEQHVKKVIIK